LGYKQSGAPAKTPVPKKVEEFDKNVVKVATGPNHTAVITSTGRVIFNNHLADGDLYTFGAGNYGMLGHGNDNSVINPKRVEFFKQNGLKVIDVACGENHTIALTGIIIKVAGIIF